MRTACLLLFAFVALQATCVWSYEGPHFEWYPILNNASCGRVCKPLGMLPVKAGGKGSSKGKVLCSLYTQYQKGGGAIDEKMSVYRAGTVLNSSVAVGCYVPQIIIGGWGPVEEDLCPKTPYFCACMPSDPAQQPQWVTAATCLAQQGYTMSSFCRVKLDNGRQFFGTYRSDFNLCYYTNTVLDTPSLCTAQDPVSVQAGFDVTCSPPQGT